MLATIAAIAAIAMSATAYGQGQAAGLGVLPLRFQAAFEGAGIETSALIGDYCESARFYTGDGNEPYLEIVCWVSDEANPPTKSRTHHIRSLRIPGSGGSALTATAVKAVLTGDDALVSAQIKNGSLTGDDLAARTLTSGTYGDGSVTGRAVQDRSLNGASLVEDTLTSSEIGPASVGSSELKNSSVTIDKLSGDLRESLGHSSRYRLYGGYISYRNHTGDNPHFPLTRSTANGFTIVQSTITAPTPGNDHLSGFWVDARYGPDSGLQEVTESAATRRASLGARFFPWPPATPGTSDSPTNTDFTFTHGGRSIHLQWVTDGTNTPKIRLKSGVTQSKFDDVDIFVNIYAEFVDAP